MRSGVAFPSYAPTFSLTSGTPNSDFPVVNLTDLVNLRRVFKASGAVVLGFTLPSAVPVGLVSLIQHNAAGASWHVVLKNGGSTVADSGVVTVNAPGIFAATTPYCPAAPVTADNGTITLASGAWSIGGVEIADFWSFTDVAVPREIGVMANDAITSSLPGVDFPTKLFSPRTLSATREAVDARVEQNFAVDFLKEKRDGPFTWVWDADDTTTWARECWLARMVDPQPFAKLATPQGRVSFKFQEHLG